MEYPKGYIESGMGNCGIFSIASLTEKEYLDVWNWFRHKYDAPGQWRGSTKSSDYLEALKHFGKSESKKIFYGDRKNKAIGKQRPVPLHYWIGIYSKKYPGKRFLVCSSTHTMAVDEFGNVLDQSGIGPVKFHKSKGRRITEAWIVE